jgi:predicted dehydrogenase
VTALRVAVWGLGPHAVRNVLPAVAAAPGLELAGVLSRTAGVVSAACETYGCATWDAAEAMLADAAVDAVYLSTPIALHAEQGRAVLAAGKHLWCEKPFTSTADEAEALAGLSRERGVSVGEAFMYLYHPHFAALAEVVRSGRIGQVLRMDCRFGIPPLERPGFRADPALGGGAFLDVGSYPLSAVSALFPGAEPEVRFAEVSAGDGSAVDTAGRTLLRCEGGVDAVLEWRTGAAYRNEIDLWGTEGSVLTGRIFSKPADYVPQLRLLDRTGRESVEEVRAGNHFVAMLEAFFVLAGDPAAAERERAAITARARLRDRVREHSNRAGEP